MMCIDVRHCDTTAVQVLSQDELTAWKTEEEREVKKETEQKVREEKEQETRLTDFQQAKAGTVHCLQY